LAAVTGWTAMRFEPRCAKSSDIGAGVIDAAKELAPNIVGRPEDAARELPRVRKKGGRLGICTWPLREAVEGIFRVARPYTPSPPAVPLPSLFKGGTGACA
jgi:hypothetical protein